MDEYTFRKIDKEIGERFQVLVPHSESEWIPVGIYNGIDIPNILVDKNNIVWLLMPNFERNCEVIVN